MHAAATTMTTTPRQALTGSSGTSQFGCPAACRGEVVNQTAGQGPIDSQSRSRPHRQRQLAESRPDAIPVMAWRRIARRTDSLRDAKRFPWRPTISWTTVQTRMPRAMLPRMLGACETHQQYTSSSCIQLAVDLFPCELFRERTNDGNTTKRILKIPTSMS